MGQVTQPRWFLACLGTLKEARSSFGLAIRMLPVPERMAMTAVYVFARLLDDAVDDGDGHTGRFSSLLVQAYGGSHPSDPVAQGLRFAAARFGVKREQLELLVRGVASDVGRKRYQTFSELYEYCYRVASSIGLICVTVLGDTSPQALAFAEYTGIAVQMTNVLRDVAEDAAMGRIYLPQEDMDAFGVRPEDLLALRDTAELRRLLRFEAERAREYHRLARAFLTGDARKRLYFAMALADTYVALLDELCSRDFDVLRHRIRVPAWRRAAIAGKWLLAHRL